jgi:hypothetical protein
MMWRMNLPAPLVEQMLKGRCHEIFCFSFFMNKFPPSLGVSHYDSFKFYRKFAEIFISQGAPPVSMTLVANLSTTPAAKLLLVSTTQAANLPLVSTILVANFATSFTSIVDTGGKFAAGVNDTGGNLRMVSMTPVANNGNNIRLLRL